MKYCCRHVKQYLQCYRLVRQYLDMEFFTMQSQLLSDIQRQLVFRYDIMHKPTKLTLIVEFKKFITISVMIRDRWKL